jgi:glycosyltransferase involved in cell wall biosynthesis
VSAAQIRVAHLVAHPIQYFAPLYRELASRPQIDLTVYFYSDAAAGEFYDPGFDRKIAWQTPLLEGYRWRVCRSAEGAQFGDGLLRRPSWDIIREVALGPYEVLWAHSYSNLNTWLTVVPARLRGVRTLIREEQTLLRSRPWYKRALKQVALRGLFALSGGLYIGEQNRRYFRHYGMPVNRLFPARYCVDNGSLQRRAAELAPLRAEIRTRFGITDEAPVVLFCGKLIEEKQPLELIEAFAAVRRHLPCWLLLVGDGPLRPSAEELVAREAVPSVRFAGFLAEPDVADAYAAADVFVLPSLRETWGLVVNEAMNFGLPIVVWDQVGCAEDLVRDGWNGRVVANRSALEGALAELVADPQVRKTYGERSRQLIDEYSIEACADQIVEACLATASGRARREA